MTIKEAAARYGVSTQAIYQRIAKAGKKAKDITNRSNGELSDEGAALLESWFANVQSSEFANVGKQTKADESKCMQMLAQIEALTAEKAALQEQIAELKRDKDRLYTLLAQEQALAMARLPAPEQKKTPPLWQRVKTFVIGEKEG